MLKLEHQGAVAVFRTDEPLTGDAVSQAAEVMRRSTGNGQRMAVLDLQNVPLIDSAALELLLDQQDAFERNGGCLKLAGANTLCHDILRCNGLQKRFQICHDVKSAVGSFVR